MLKSYIDEFIEDEVMDEKAAATYNKYRKVVNDFVDFFDKEDVSPYVLFFSKVFLSHTHIDVVHMIDFVIANFMIKISFRLIIAVHIN